MDRTHTPCASAQYVLETIGDYEDPWGPSGGDRLMALLTAWDENPNERSAIEEEIRDHLRGLLRESRSPA